MPPFKNKKKFFFTAAAIVLVVAVGFFYGGFRFGLSKANHPPSVSGNELLKADFSLFWDAVNLVKSKFIDVSEVDDQKILYGAIKGVVGALDDPYSAFYNPEDAKKLSQDLIGSFGGIGAEIGIRNGQLVVVAPLKGNPAEAAGLKAGDKILKINDAFTNDFTIDEAVKLIRGEVGTEVSLLILRDGWDEAKEFKIKRAIIQVPTLDWEMRELGEGNKKINIAYIKLYNFNANAPQLFYQAALSALLRGVDGMVLDLRNNPGGFLDVSVNIAGWFLDRGQVVVRERFSPQNYEDLRANGNGALKDLPLVVIVNAGSASASEILAGALRDNRGVKIIGEKTFGKGTVQEVDDLKDGSSLKISIAEWLTPAGHEINKKGITPDFEVKTSDKDAEENKDPQLDKALEVLGAEIQKSGRRLFVLGS